MSGGYHHIGFNDVSIRQDIKTGEYFFSIKIPDGTSLVHLDIPKDSKVENSILHHYYDVVK